MNIYYYDPFSVFPLIKANLDAKLPLTNLHWKIDSQLKSIPKLEVNFVEYIPRHHNSPKTNVVNTDIHLMFVLAKDIEIYRSQVRPLVKEWLKVVDPSFLRENDNPVNWLVVYYSPYKKSKMFKMSIYDKIKVDFVHGFKLVETNDNEVEKLEIYNDFIVELKQLILSTFDRCYLDLNQKLNQPQIQSSDKLKYHLCQSEILKEMNLFKDSLNILKTANSLVNNECSMSQLTHLIPETDICIDEALKIKYGIFLRQYELTKLLIDQESLPSINAIYISNLLQTLITVLSDFDTANENHIDILIAIIQIADKYLYKDIFQDIFQHKVESRPVFEFRGELRLLQRVNVIKLANLLGYTIYNLTDIPLDDNKLPEDMSKAKKLAILSDQESFYKYFQTTTELIIKDFLECGRTKTIDMLSVDLAFLNYLMENYVECLNILQNSYQFYIDGGWNYLGNLLLEIYIDCLEKVKGRPEVLINSYIKLLTNFNLGHNKVDVNKLKYNSDLFNIDLSVDVVVKNQVFGVDLIPKIYTEQGSYFITVDIHNIFKPTKFDSVVLELTGVEFKLNACDIETGCNKLKLKSNKFVLGFLRPIRLVLTIGKLQLVHSFTSTPEIYFHQFPENFNANVEFNPQFTLGNPQLLFTFDHAVDDLQILSSQHFTFEKFIYKSRDKTFTLPIIPNEKVITVKFKVSYGENIYIMEKQVDTTLLLSVTVQDTFKTDVMFLRFQITPIATPIRILSVNLVSKINNVKKPINSPTAIIDSGETYSSFYRIAHTNDINDFQLEIEYSSIHSECITQLAKNIDNKLIFDHLVANEVKFDYSQYYTGTLKILNGDELSRILEVTIPETVALDDVNFVWSKLIIEVPMPQIDILQILDYHYPQKQKYVVGEPINVEIEIQTTTKWGFQKVQDTSILAESSTIDEQEQYTVSLMNDDNWLVSGFKRKGFYVDLNKPNGTNCFKLMFIPLTVGYLCLPRLSIKFDNKDLRIDSLMKSGTESLLIVPELDTITFSF